MASSTSPRSQQNAEFEYRRSFQRLELLNTFVQLAIKWGVIAYGFHCAYLMTMTLAGRSTFADIGVRVLGNIKVSNSIVALLAGGGWVYGLGQRQLRRKNIKRIVPAKNALEKLLNPTRTSSYLTDIGTTPKADAKEDRQ